MEIIPPKVKVKKSEGGWIIRKEGNREVTGTRVSVDIRCRSN